MERLNPKVGDRMPPLGDCSDVEYPVD